LISARAPTVVRVEVPGALRVVHRGLLRVVIVAKEGIAPGCQVLVDYGDAYWRASGVAPRPLPRILADVGTDRYRF